MMILIWYLIIENAAMQALNLLYRILDPSKQMKSMVNLWFFQHNHAVYICKSLPGILMHSSFIMDQ